MDKYESKYTQRFTAEQQAAIDEVRGTLDMASFVREATMRYVAWLKRARELHPDLDQPSADAGNEEQTAE